jgi:hypothetical protein
MLATLAESRVVRIAIAIGLLVVTVLVVTRLVRDEDPRTLVDANERTRALAMGAAWLTPAETARCPRPALREPVTGDGSPLLAGVIDRQSPETRCLERAGTLQLQACAIVPCPMIELGSLAPHPEIVEACTPLYDKIARLAHATEACSPTHAGAYDMDAVTEPFIWLAYAVRLRIAPLVANGDLAVAARHVTDAVRFADDRGRSTVLADAMISLAVSKDLADTLDELLADPRLTADDARAIARDLDVLLASMPAFGEVVRQEAVWIATHDELPSDLTHDREQDRALRILGVERWLHDFDRTCKGVSLRACVERLQATAPSSVTGPDELERVLRSGLDDDAVRERVIQLLASDLHVLMPAYAGRFGYQELALIALRMQAELRTASVEECRDPERRRARLAKWLRDDITLGNEAEPTLSPPAWQSHQQTPPGPPRVLRCIAR